MKQASQNITDRGWDKMFPILEEEMPQKKKKRKFGLWLLVPIGIGLVTLAFHDVLFPNESTTPKPINSTSHFMHMADNSNKTNDKNSIAKIMSSPDTQISHNQNDGKEIKTVIPTEIKNEKNSKDIAVIPQRTTNLITETQNNVSSYNLANLQTTNAAYIPTIESSIDNNRTETEAKTIPTLASSEKATQSASKVRKQIIPQGIVLPSIALAELPLLDSEHDFASNMPFASYHLTKVLDSPTDNSSWVYNFGLNYTNTFKMPAHGVEGQFTVSKKINDKWTVGLSAGVGGISNLNPDLFQVVTSLAESASVTEPNNITGFDDFAATIPFDFALDTIQVSGSNSLSSESPNDFSDVDLYFIASVNLGYQLSNKLNIGLSTGVEAFRINENNSDFDNAAAQTDMNTSGATTPNSSLVGSTRISNSSSPNNLYASLSADYQLTENLHLTASYRKLLTPYFSSLGNDTFLDKVSLGAKYYL